MGEDKINGYIYPQVQVITIPGVDNIANLYIELYTEIRKQSEDGEWYLWPVRIRQMMSYPNMTMEEIHHLYAKFIKEVYNIMCLGVINKGEMLYKKDSDTRTEQERMRDLSSLNTNNTKLGNTNNTKLVDGNKEAV